MKENEMKYPNHVAIIVDGNGRWAQERGMSRSRGHDAGYKNLKKLGKYILSLDISVLSVYLFSTENFKRNKEEVDYLMDLFVKMFQKDIQFFISNNIKVVVSGRDELLPAKVIEVREKIVRATKDNTGGILNICLNYGGRAEIVDATKKMIAEGISANEVDEKFFQKYLYQDLPDVDLLIRTSGEQRLSNFLLWQVSYAEFYFAKKYFPDFNEEDFDEAIREYNSRNRKFGGNAKS